MLCIKTQIQALRNSAEDIKVLPASILESASYSKVMWHLSNKKAIKDEDPLWTDLEKMVLDLSPIFNKRLYVLSDGKLKPDQYRLCLLLKLRMTTTNISILINRSKPTVVYQRNALGMMFFGEKTDLKDVDSVIRML